MAAGYEQDIILDADGKPIFAALDRVQRQIEAINRNVVATAAALNKTVTNMGTMLNEQGARMQQGMQQVSTLAKAQNFPGFNVQDTTYRQKLGKMTTAATEYARGLELAGNSVDAFSTRLNRLNDNIAKRGRLGFGETIAQTKQRKGWEDQRKAVVELDRALDKLQSKAGRTSVSGADRTAAGAMAARLAEAQSALFNAARDPKRSAFGPEIGNYRAALNDMENFYSSLRTRQAQRLTDERSAAKAAERVEVSSLNNRAAQEEKMWAARDAARGRDSTAEAKRRKDEDAAWKSRESRHSETIAAEKVKSKYLNDNTENLRRQTQQTLKLSEAEKLGMDETGRRNFGGVTRTQQATSELDDMKAAGVQRAAELRDLRALDNARGQSAMRLNELRAARRAANNPQDHDYLTRQIKGEQAYTAALRSRRAEMVRSAAPERQSPIQNILSPGYMGAALARTSVYGAGAMAAYGAFDAVAGGLTYVAQFEDELAKLQAIAGATTGQMVTLKESILDVAGSSRYSTVDLVKISQSLAQAGVSSSQMKDALSSVISLATASGSTPDESVNLVTAALGAFQMQASEAARVADLMVTALNRTRLTVAQAGAAIQYVGATAYEQNITFDELMATAAAMSQAGIKSGSTIGTGLRQFLVDLQSPSAKLQEQFDKLGLSTAQLDVTTQGLPAVLEALGGAGFGAAQAYEGLETRAAAAYLVLKNNTGLIDELRLQMTESGAATDANAVAMDTLIAQWQRFRNLLNDRIGDLLSDNSGALKDFLKEINDIMDDYQNGRGSWMKKQLGYDVGDIFKAQQDNLIALRDNAATAPAREMYEELAIFMGYTSDAGDRLAQSQADLETQVNNTAEKISENTGKVTELEKEYQRLLVQQDLLSTNHDRMDAETASLTSRFSELGLYLDNTKSQYDSLTGAVWAYIEATNKALASDLSVRQSQLAQQGAGFARERVQAQNNITSAEIARLPKDVQALLSELRSGSVKPRSGETDVDRYRFITRRLAGEATRLTDARDPLGAKLDKLVGAMGNFTSTVTARGIAERQENAAIGASTPQGVAAALKREEVESLLTRARSQRGNERDVTIGKARGGLAALDELLNFTPKKEFEQYFASQKAEADSLKQLLKSLTSPSGDDEKARKAAEREAKADKIIEFGNPLATMRPTSGMGLRGGRQHKGIDLGGKTGDAVMVTADGVVKKVAYEQDGYGNYVIVDHGGGTETRYAHLSQRDVVEGQAVKKGQRLGAVGSTGRSTGPHLHYEVRENGSPVDPTRGRYSANPDVAEDAQKYEDQAKRERDRMQKALDQREVKLAEQKLEIAVKNAAKATTSEAFAAAIAETETALKGLEDALNKQANNELAGQGLGPLDPEYYTRLDQLQTDIKQRGEEYRAKVVDGIFANVSNAFKAAELATAVALTSYDRAVKMAQARVTGLGYASMEGRVPEYMKQLASRRVAQGEEDRDRARFGQLPAEIGEKQSALDAATNMLSMLPAETAAYENQKLKVDELRESIRQLAEEKDALFIALNMADEMPKTLEEGLNKAIEAYREYNNLNRTLQEEIIFNMGGALAEVHTGLNTFFTDIFTGSKNVLTAFGDLVLGLSKYLQQMAAQFVANQVFKLLLNLIGSTTAPVVGGGGNIDGTTIGSQSPFGLYHGGRVIKRAGGGPVTAGVPGRDSTLAMLARDEWVVNRSAVDSVGHDFMSDLNKRGASAVRDAGGGTQMFQMPKQEANIYVVSPQHKPSLGPNDVLVVLRDDMVNGESRKLIKTIAQGG